MTTNIVVARLDRATQQPRVRAAEESYVVVAAWNLSICFKIEGIGEGWRNDTRLTSGMHIGLENERVNRRGFLKAGAAATLSYAALSACAREQVTLHYRLKVVVEIDGQQYEGTSVVETQIDDRHNSPRLVLEAPEIVSRSWGEAVVVDLEQSGFLFGLLIPHDGVSGFNGLHPDIALSRCLPPADRNDRENLLRNIQALQGECELLGFDRPALVRFRDISDPSSVERVEPERFSEAYAPNAAFVRATISATNDPVTRPMVDRILPWLTKPELSAPGSTLVGKLPVGFHVASEMTMAQRLRVRNFKLRG
jgi:hypothetical protein